MLNIQPYIFVSPKKNQFPDQHPGWIDIDNTISILHGIDMDAPDYIPTGGMTNCRLNDGTHRPVVKMLLRETN